MRRFYLLALGLVGFGLAAVNVQAAEVATVTSEVPNAALKELNDPTILTRRLWLETEWNKFKDSTNVVEETLGTLWPWRVSANQDWAVRLKLPIKFRFGSDTPGVSDIEGLGDIKIATGTAVRLSKTLRIGFGVDLQMPTGREELSDNKWRIQEFAAIGWTSPRGSPSALPSSITNRSRRKAVVHPRISWRHSSRSPSSCRTSGLLLSVTRTRPTSRTTTTSPLSLIHI